MMVSLQKVGICFSGISGLGAISTMGAYNGTLKTIEDEVKNHCLFSKVDKKFWTKAYEENKSNFSSDNTIFKQVTDGTKLQEICKQAYSSIFSSIFHKEKDDLKTKTQKYCSLTIEKALENKIEVPAQDSTTNEQIFQKKLEELKKDDSIVDKNLLPLKEESGQNWSQLQEWCKKTYGHQYTRDNDEWKYAQKYCVKTIG